MRVQPLLRPTQVHLLRRPIVVETTSEPSFRKSCRSCCHCTLAPWSSSWWLPSEEQAPHSKSLRSVLLLISYSLTEMKPLI
ncbi:hypothetical protein Taro_051683 [Colocasia esculenta]|uniref:Uncharacterized protein n=1 Tax=Colocasia esculenta TaxID=4460 RepID=A0A843XGJ9_COLES|nr:hypothetical protein [Colocasia esculenta]